jgi:predicted RNase H-like nuclease (RuvC/YqgF family)
MEQVFPANGAQNLTDPGAVNPAGEPKVDPVKELETLKAQLSDFTRERETLKAQISGLDKAITTVKSENETLKKKAMTAEELQAEKERETQNQLAAANEKLRVVAVKEALIGEGLNPDFAKFINDADPEAIKASVLAIKKSIKDEADKEHKAFVAEQFKGKAPTTGQPPSGKTITEADFLKLTPKEQAKIMGEGYTIRG